MQDDGLRTLSGCQRYNWEKISGAKIRRPDAKKDRARRHEQT